MAATRPPNAITSTTPGAAPGSASNTNKTKEADPKQEVLQTQQLIRDQLPIQLKVAVAPAQAKKTKKLSDEEKGKAALAIQSHWRYRNLALKFLKNMHATYVAVNRTSLDDKTPKSASATPPSAAGSAGAAASVVSAGKDEKITDVQVVNKLAELMIGRTIAHLKDGTDITTGTPYAHALASYHRCDILDSKLLTQLLKEYNPSIPDQSNFITKLFNKLSGPNSDNTSKYIPISLLQNLTVDDVINNYLREYKDLIEVRMLPGSPIAFLKIKAFSKDKEAQKKIVSRFTETGLIASPWEISIMYAKLGLAVEKASSDMKSDELARLLKHAPKSIKDLKESPLMGDIARIALSKNAPTKHLATCLFKMLRRLPEIGIDKKILEKIYIFLNIILKFYKNNYERFAWFLYAINHEISLILFAAAKQNKLGFNFADFKDETIKNAISAFGLKQDPNSKYRFCALPAMAGANAHAMALKIAKSIAGKDHIIEVVDKQYFEFNHLVTSNSTNKDADIYMISAGPVLHEDGIRPGVDINKLIRSRILRGDGTIKKPVVIVIDATTAPYKNLKIDPDLQKHIESGDISIIVHESHQKFGLAHTDQAQYGRVFCVLGNKLFKKESIDQLEVRGQQDLLVHMDMMIGAYINISCGNTLEKIKQSHFDNGTLLRNLLRNLGYLIKDPIVSPVAFAQPSELYFTSTSNFTPLAKQAVNVFDYRTSFGHFSTTYAYVDSTQRISPNASDKIDILVSIAQLHFAVKLNTQQVMEMLIDKVKNQGDKKLAIDDEIILFGLALNLKSAPAFNENNYSKIMDCLKFILDKSSDSLVHRKCYKQIVSLYEKQLLNYKNKAGSKGTVLFKPQPSAAVAAAVGAAIPTPPPVSDQLPPAVTPARRLSK